MKRLSVKLVGFIVAFSVVLLTSCSFGTGAALTTASIPTNSPAPSATIIFEKQLVQHLIGQPYHCVHMTMEQRLSPFPAAHSPWGTAMTLLRLTRNPRMR